jgi:hypothetical protein
MGIIRHQPSFLATVSPARGAQTLHTWTLLGEEGAQILRSGDRSRVDFDVRAANEGPVGRKGGAAEG